MLVFVSCFVCAHSFATDYYVNDNATVGDVYTTAIGNNANNGLTVATPKLTLTNLLSTYGPSGSNVLTSGDVIYIDAGNYYRTDKNLTLSVNGLSIIGADPDRTVFDNDRASADANLLFTITGDNITIEGILIVGYNKGTGGASAVHINGATGIVFNNVLTDENTPGGGSAAILVNNSSSVIFNGGGSNCNSASSVAGGGVNIEGVNNTVTFNDYSFARNSKDYQAGSGLFVVCSNGSTTVTVNRTIFEDNFNGTTTGGAAIFVSGATVNVNNSCFSNNESGAVSSTNYGGAISVGRGATMNINNCTFTNNFATSSSRGGAIAINPVSVTGGGAGSSTVNLTTCSFSGNTSAQGNHLYTRTTSSVNGFFNVSECTFTAPGSGVSVYSTVATSTITLANSSSPSNSGPAGSIIFTNTTIPSLTASTTCPALQGTCYGVILPVELKDFNAFCDQNKTMIYFSTASERNNDYFTLEKGDDFGNFKFLAKISGNANSSMLREYFYEDFNMNSHENYYRLSQTDFDGKREILQTIYFDANCNTNSELQSANIKENQCLIQSYFVKNKKYEISIINSLGKVVKTENFYSEQTSFSKSINFDNELANGMYVINIASDQNIKSIKVVK